MKQQTLAVAAIHERRRQLCNGTSGTLISIAVGNETRSCQWVEALLQNALAFSRRDTRVVVHISSTLSCAAVDLVRWNRSSGADRVLVNPVRLATRLGHGSVLYSHLLNARAAAARWRGCCCQFVMQASNMLWVRRGMEARVDELGCSVGREGWRKPNKDMPLLMSGFLNGTVGDKTSARIYRDLTRTQRKMTARAIFALRVRQPEQRRDVDSSLHGGGASEGRHAWSYHEGSFYPHATVLRFLAYLEAALTFDEIMLSSNSPEEWWLPAWTLNREPSTTPVQRTTQQLCMRLNISFRASRVPFRYVQKAEDDLACPQRPGSFRYYAVKRFSRDASDVVVAGILKIHNLADLWDLALRGTLPVFFLLLLLFRLLAAAKE